MNVVFHKNFENKIKKLPPNVKQKIIERLSLFSNDPLNPHLCNRALNTPYKGSYSIGKTSDYRAIYQLVDDDMALFTHIDTHSQLYRQFPLQQSRSVIGYRPFMMNSSKSGKLRLVEWYYCRILG